ncbi:MAG: S41 family peptidase [Candidatus Pacebacteria bacterium]|nr:S41 family peptidase [Candidatus Paceibacterota bacterium]
MKNFVSKIKSYVNSSYKAFFQIIISVFIILGVYYIGFIFGTRHPKQIVVEGIKNMTDSDIKADMGIFWEAFQKLRVNHYDSDKTTEKDFVYGAISGLASTFGDPNTVFFEPVESKKFKDDISGSFGGIGAEIGIKEGSLMIVAPIKDSPSDRAGLKPGDRIFKIEGKITSEMTVPEAVNVIRGKIGTQVNLSIYRDTWAAPKEFSITREEIVLPNLESKMLDDKIMYMRLHNFNEKSVSQFSKAASEFSNQGGKGLIFDLRGNPGGYLQVAVDLAGWFIKNGSLVVTQDYKNSMDFGFHSNGNEFFLNTPVVLLLDQGSASASEILAGALKFNRPDIKIVGAKSFGKGTVQDLEDLSDGSQLKVTIAHWIMPNGTSIEKNGIAPDYEVQILDDDIKNKNDAQMNKALEVLKLEMFGTSTTAKVQ